MAIDLERILRERKYNAQKGRDDVGIVPYNGNGRGIVGKIPYTGKESNGGSAGASGNTQDGNVPSVKRMEPSDEVKNAVHKSLARISGIPMTGRDDVGIVPYSGNGGESQGFTNLAPTRKNEFMLANMQKNYVSPEVKNAVDKAFERMGAVKAPSSPYSPYKTGSLDNQIEYAEQEYNARNEEYKDRLRMVRNRYTPEQGKAMLEKNKIINNQKDYRGAIDRADEKLENLKNIRYNIDIKNKRAEMEKVVNNKDFERYSADPGGKKEISFFRYIDPRYNAINQPIAYADEKERKIYFYYLEKEGQKKADEYYKTIERELTARRAVQKSNKDEKFGNEHKILASAETIAASIPALKDFNSEVRKYIKNKKNGTYEPMNPDSMNFDTTRKQMDLEQGITKDMSGAGRFFTQTGLSMGKSLASSLFGKFGLAIMSGNAAAQSTFEALKNGATSRQALTKGLADGFTEYITEKIPFDNFFKIVKGGNIKGAKALLKNILKQAGAEGSGEALAEYMNYAIDRYVMGDKSDFNSLVNTYIENGYTAEEAEKEAYKQYLIVNPALAFAGGAISGLGMGGVAQTTNYLAGKWQNHIEGKTAENKNAPSRPTENVQGSSSDMSASSDGGVIFEPPAQNGISENIGNNTEPMQSVLKSGQIENDIDIDGEGIGNNQTEAEKLAGARLERILKNRFGVETVHFNDENGSKGYYDPKTKKIYTNDFYTVNRYATTAHEFFHSYKDIDIEGYNVIKKAVLADLSLEEYNKYKERQINLRNSNNLDTENIDIDGLVAEEVISDLGAEVLKNPESLEGIFKRFENDKTFIEKFMDYIRGLVRKVREFLNSDYIENDNDIRNLVKNYSEIENIYRSILESGGTMDYSAEGNDTGVKYSITDANDTEKIGVKQQIKNNSETLGKMEPVYNSNLEVEKKGRMENQEWVMNLFKNYNYQVFREGLGKIIIDRKRIRNSLRYLKTDGDLAAYAALPAVLENGKIIGGHTNHKSRGYETVTIGAPIVINGVRGNMAAVVRMDEHGNYYKIHRILMPDGSSFVYENKISNAETAEADLQNKPVVSPTDVAYNDSVSQDNEDVNINKISNAERAEADLQNKPVVSPADVAYNDIISQNDEDVKYKLPTAEEKQDAISRADVEAVQSIPRKSVNDFTSDDIKKTENFARKYFKEMGTKSPFFRSWFGDWRANDNTEVKIANQRGAVRGTTKNNDTGWDIQISGKVFNETKGHNAPKNKKALPYLDYINSIVENSVLLDSYTIPNEKAKSDNSAMMHTLYAISNMGKGNELIKLYVEELNDVNNDGTIKRAYQLQNINKILLESNRFSNNSLASSDQQNTYTVSQLFDIVKRFDKNFNPKSAGKVVNEDGTPKVVYHGTDSDFTVFDITKSRSYDGTLNYDLPGFYFSENTDEAGSYGNFKEYYLDLKNPYEGDIVALAREKGSYRNAYDYLVSRGYDGMIVDDMGEGFAEYIVFNSNQIKSATDNIGTFDGGNDDIRYKLPTAEEKQDEEMRKEAKKQLKKYFDEIKGDKAQTQAETTKPRQSKFDKFKEAYRQYTIPVPEKRERIFLPPRGEVTAYKKDVSERRETLLKAKKVAEKDFNNVQSDAEKSKIKNTLSLIEEYIRTNDKQKSLIKKIEQAYTEENNKRDTQKANTASERLAELERKERIRQADTAEREQIKIKRAKEKERAFWDGIEKKAEEYEIVKAKRALKEMAKAVRAEDERYIEFEERVTEKPVRISRLERMEKAAEDFKSNGDIHKLPKQSDYNAFKKAIADKDIYYDNLEHYIKNHIETAKKESDKRLSENTFDFETEQKISEKKIAENALDLFNKKRTEYENGEKERAKKVIQVLDEAYKVVDLDKAREKAYRMSQQNEEYEVVKAKRAMNEMSKEAKQATDEGLDIEKYYNTPREKRVTEKDVKAPRLERMEKASEDFKKTGDSFKLPKKSDYNSYKRDAQRKSIYYNNIETYMKNQLSGARSDVEYDVIKKALDMFLQKKVAYENGEKARAQEVITSMDEAYKMLDTKRNFKLTKEIAEDITDKGKTVFSYKSKDFFRNMREVFGKHYGVVKDIIDDFNNSKGDMARSINERLADLYQTVVKDLGISKGSRESAAVMWYGEGEKAPDLTNADDIALLKKMGIKDFKKLDPDIKVKYDGARLEQDFGHGTAEKIRKADAYFRKVYDEYIDALNAEIKEIYPFNPKKQIQKRKNYYRHFDELTNTYYSLFEMLGQNANIDPSLAGISPYTKPKSKWSSIEQKRKGKATVEDAVGGFLNYIPMAEYRLNIDKHISVIRTLASDLAELKGDNGNANNFIKFLNDYANDLAGKTVSNLDRVLIDFGGRKIVKGLSWVNNRVKTNKVLGNIASTAKQILNQTNGFLVLENPKNMISGYADWFNGVFGKNADILKRYGESNFLTERFVDDSFSKFEKKSLQSICANLLGATDEMGVRIIWNAAYNEALDINKTGGEKINPARYADDAARNACGGRGIGEVPLIYKSQVAKLALPFQLEVQNNWKVIYDYFANRGISGERIKPEKDVKKKIAKAVSFLIASFGLNWLTETLTGSKGSMDIIGDIADGFGQGFKEKKSDETWKKILQGTKRSAQNISADALDNRLFGWVYASILESIDEDYSDKFFNGNFQSNGVNIPAGQSAVKIAKKARQGDFAGAGAEVVTSFVTPYGGAQIDKTIRGLTDWGKGAKYQNDAYKKVSKFFANRNSSDYEGVDGKKKYDIKKNPLTFVQSALFGPSALGGDYYNDQKTAQYIKDEEKAQRAKREEKFRKNYKNESVIYLAKAQKDNDLIPYDEVKSDFKFTHKKQEYEFTIPKEAKEEYDKMLLDEMEKEYDKVMDKPEYIGALNARKAEILKDAKSKARKTVNAKIKKDYLDGKFGE